MIRVLIYGDVDLNLIDGSSIWLASFTEVLGGGEDVSVTLLLKAPITRDIVIRRAAALPNVQLVDPWQHIGSDPEFVLALAGCSAKRMSANEAVAVLQLLCRRDSYDVIFVRSVEVARALVELPELAPRLWVYVTDPKLHSPLQKRRDLSLVAARCGRILCQTDEARGALESLIDCDAGDKIVLLPPMIPDLAPTVKSAPNPAAPRLGYSGKFSPPYRILEMLDAFEKIRTHIPGCEFHVVGDKFHNAPPVDNFIDLVRKRLTATPGVVWHGGVSRDEANAILGRVDVAASWRSPTFDDSVEMSTKILEYSGLGIPVLMNPSPVQKQIFGPEYPAYVSSSEEFVSRFRSLVESPLEYVSVSQFVRQTAARFTFENVRARLLPLLRGGVHRVRFAPGQTTILWVGHDFKFLRPIKEAIEVAGRHRSIVDEQVGHVIDRPERSLKLIEQADLIFCEWCLGNAVWYSRAKHHRQRLVIRLHRQEIELPFLQQIRWDNVDRVVFISDWVMKRFLEMFPEMSDRALLICNALECRLFDMEKLPGAEFNLGLLGWCPKLKAPHLAIDILARLKQIDRRYTLFVKGKPPWQFSWLWKRSEERQYYEELRARIDQSVFANSVVFDPHGEDVPAWLSKVGFILSTSDLEGSHQAVAEGMAAGSIPVIRNWHGASRMYPSKYIFPTVDEAVSMVRKWQSISTFEFESAYCRRWVQRFDVAEIVVRFEELFASLLSEEAPGVVAGRPALSRRPPVRRSA